MKGSKDRADVLTAASARDESGASVLDDLELMDKITIHTIQQSICIVESRRDDGADQ